MIVQPSFVSVFFYYLSLFDIASSLPPMPNYVYVIVRLKISENANSIPSGLLCRYGEYDHVCPIGGLVKPNETLMGNTIRHYYHHLVYYRLKSNDRLYLVKVLNFSRTTSRSNYLFVSLIFSTRILDGGVDTTRLLWQYKLYTIKARLRRLVRTYLAISSCGNSI